MRPVQQTENVSHWLTHRLFELGAVKFGDFTLGRTAVHSPVYINPRLIISEPALLAQLGQLIDDEIKAAQSRRRPRMSPFSLVAGVPFGGLHLATSYSLIGGVPMIYVRPGGMSGKDHTVEGAFEPAQTALIVDDLMTGGGSILQTAHLLEEVGLEVRDALVLIDREQGGAERLRERGYNVISILRLKTMLTYYYESELITPTWYQRSMEYLEQGQSNQPTG